jgi:chromosome partitioning protein
VVAVTAQKGGVGKTSTVVHLATELARRGLRILVVDLDPQAAATALLAPSAAPERGTVDVLLDHVPVVDVAVERPAGPDLVAATPGLVRAELALAAELGREAVLRLALEAVPADRWHLVLLDTPPSLGLLTINGLVAADACLTPVLPTLLSLASVRQLEQTVAQVRQRLNRKLRPLGYLLSVVDERERLAEESREALRAHAGGALWPVEIRTDARVKSSLAGEVRGRAGDDYERAAEELGRRLGLRLRPAPPKGQGRLFEE